MTLKISNLISIIIKYVNLINKSSGTLKVSLSEINKNLEMKKFNLGINKWLEEIKNTAAGDEYCQFKCNENEKNQSIIYCIDQSLVCDNQIDCIVNNQDELICKYSFSIFYK